MCAPTEIGGRGERFHTRTVTTAGIVAAAAPFSPDPISSGDPLR